MPYFKYLLSLLLGAAAASHAQLAQEPLLNRPNSVPPNVSLIFDNSSSMWGNTLFEYGQINPDRRFWQEPVGPAIGSWVYPGTMHWGTFSPDVNKLAYDPRVRYAPRIDYRGQPLTPPNNIGFSMYVYFRRTSGPYVYDNNGPLAKPDGYYTPSYTPQASEVVPGSTAVYPNYVFDNNIPDTFLYPKWVNRTDCVALPTACTMSEERRNYNTWNAWYKLRFTSTTTALGYAMKDLPPDSFRLAWGTLTSLTQPVPTMVRGMSSYDSNPGGTKEQLYTWLYSNMAQEPGTPSRKALLNAGNYHQRTDSDGPWATVPNPASVRVTTEPAPSGPGAAEPTASHASCRRSYALLVTDGFWNDPAPTAGLNSDNTGFSIAPDVGPAFTYNPAGPYKDSWSDTLADLAMHFWGRDLRPDLPNRVPPVVSGPVRNPSTWQNMSFNAVTLSLPGSLPQTTATLASLTSGAIQWPQPQVLMATVLDDIWHATINGRGELLDVKSTTDLTAAIKRMMSNMVGTPQTLSGVAVSSTYLKNGTRKYKPQYIPGAWSGNLAAIELDSATGNERTPPVVFWEVEAPLDGNGDPVSKIPAPGARNIATWNGSMGVAFNAANTGLGADLVDYLRGDTSKERRKPGGIFRDRTSRLGDIVNSNPVFLKDSLDLGYEQLVPRLGDYRAFMAAKAARAGTLFVGANDGMLHAFRDSDGVETFAYVPKAVVPNLHKLGAVPFVHQYYVDGPSVETDAWLDGVWKNVLLGTTGAGAKAVFALDVTDTDSMDPSKILWEVSAANPSFTQLGHVLTDVQAGLLRSNQWVAIFGNGVGSAGGRASLFVVDLRTGALVSELVTSVSGGNGLGGVRPVYDDQKRLVGAYAGDLKGNMWKFDLVNMTVGLAGAPLYAAGATQPITAAPAVLPHPVTGYVVAFGTGKFLEASDVLPANYSPQRLYGAWDAQPFGAAATPSGASFSGLGQLVRQTISSVVSGSATFYAVSANIVDWGDGLSVRKRGWYIDLPYAGQRTVYPVERLPGTFVMASTLSPESSTPPDVCVVSGAGSGWVYIIDGVTGSGTVKPTLDTNNDGVVNGDDVLVSGFRDAVDGRPTPISISSTRTKDVLCIETAQSNCTRVELECGQAGGKACPPTTAATGIKSRDWRQLFMR